MFGNDFPYIIESKGFPFTYYTLTNGITFNIQRNYFYLFIDVAIWAFAICFLSFVAYLLLSGKGKGLAGSPANKKLILIICSYILIASLIIAAVVAYLAKLQVFQIPI